MVSRTAAVLLAALLASACCATADAPPTAAPPAPSSPSAPVATGRGSPPLGMLSRGVVLPTEDVALVVTEPRPYEESAASWTFDLASHLWRRAADVPRPEEGVGPLVLHEAAGAVLALPAWDGPVLAMSLADRTWTALSTPAVRPQGLTDAVYDPGRRLVIAWDDREEALWTYDLASNAWRRVPRGTGDWPTTQSTGEPSFGSYSLLTFDTRADAAVLAVAPAARPGSTWLFHPATGRWERTAAVPPELMLGYGERGTEAVFDPVHGRSVLIARGRVALYDSARDAWEVPSPDGWPAYGYDTRWLAADGTDTFPLGMPAGPLARMYHQAMFDPASARVLMMGGEAYMPTSPASRAEPFTWQEMSDVWAYDVGDNAWARLD